MDKCYVCGDRRLHQRGPRADHRTDSDRRPLADHHAIDADFYRQLAEVFTTAQIVELGFSCAEMMGLHRFIHTLDIFGDDPPVLAYAADQVDSRHTEPVHGADR